MTNMYNKHVCYILLILAPMIKILIDTLYYFTDFSLSFLYLVVEGTVLPSSPNQLHFSATQLGVLYLVLCLHVISVHVNMHKSMIII